MVGRGDLKFLVLVEVPPVAELAAMRVVATKDMWCPPEPPGSSPLCVVLLTAVPRDVAVTR